MRLLIAGLTTLALLCGSFAVAQDDDEKVIAGQERAAGLTPEMRAYLDEVRRQNDPKMNAKRAAMQKAEQRRMRLASQQWYGYSTLRPIANPFPITSSYSPMWGSGDNSYLWYGYTSTAYVDQHMTYAR